MQSSLETISRGLTRLLAAMIVVFGFPAVTWAQAAAGGDESAKGFVNQYAIAIFLVAMGLIVICMPSRRADEPKFKREF